jgi:hypothetical protein
VRSPLRFLRRRHDPFGDAAERMERSRQAREEIGDPLADSPLGLVPMRRPGGRWMWVFLGAALLIGAVVSMTQTRNPALPANCHASALKLSTDEPSLRRPVAWKATGPVGDYVLAIDVTAVSRVGVRGVAVAAPTTGDTWLGQLFRMNNCTASGRFSLTLGPGEHTVRMFRFAESGATVAEERTITIRD